MARAARIDRNEAAAIGAQLFGAAVIVGLGVAAVTLGQQQRLAPGRRRPADKRAALEAYLHEHLAGADAAIRVVDRLRLTHAGTREGLLFASLFDEFREEREIVRSLLERLGATAQSARRLAGETAGVVLPFTAGGDRGDLSLFRTLEALAIGVQGKRLMWRGLLALLSNAAIPGTRSLAGLEAMAVRQWEAIEERRRLLVAETFGGLDLSDVEPPLD